MSEAEAPESPARGSLGRKLLVFLAWWGPVAVILGIAACSIPWGNPKHIHGQGWPFPSVMWDKPAGYDRAVDYPNPLACVENPAAFFLAGVIVRMMLHGLGKMLRRSA